MALDIIEIALDRLTDATEFERIATEVIYNRGYYDIIPLSGGNDFGQDAVEDKFYESNTVIRTVFQFTLQSYAKGKIEKTIIRLKESNIKFSMLVYVSKRPITGENQELLRADVRKNHKVELVIIEKETLILVLSDFKNGIFQRHFPNIEKQLEALKSSKPILSEENKTELEYAILKTAIAFTFNEDATKARKGLFDNLILSLLYFKGKEVMSSEDIVKLLREEIDSEFNQIDQVRASLDRLKKNQFVKMKLFGFVISQEAIKQIESINIKANNGVEMLMDNVLNRIQVLTTKVFSDQEIMRIKRNVAEVLVEIFKLNGIEISNQILDADLENGFNLERKQYYINKAKDGLPIEIGEMLVTSLGEILRNPSEAEADILALMSKAFIGAKIMNIDPNLKELQHSHFSQKYFFLDTDFLLNCLIKERPDQSFYLNIVKTISELGSRVVIPKCVFDEALLHANIAHRSFSFFGDSLHNLSEDFIDFEVHNLFTQGYFYYYKKQKSSFDTYISNYSNPSSPHDYFFDVLKSTLPKNVVVEGLENFRANYPIEELDNLTDYFYEGISEGLKAKYRTAEQNKKLAKNDAELFLVAYYLNREKFDEKRVLGGKAYLLTYSRRYIKGARVIGLEDIITASPQTIASLLEIIGKTNIPNKEYIRLMNNPLMVYSVEQSWEDVQAILKMGVSLNGKSLTNLRWEFKTSLHDQIKGYFDSDKKHETNQAENNFQRFYGIVQESKRLGYKLLPELNEFMENYEGQKDKYDELVRLHVSLKDDYQLLKKESSKLTTSKEKYLVMRLKNRKK